MKPKVSIGKHELLISNVFFSDKYQKWAFVCRPVNSKPNCITPVLRWFPPKSKGLKSFIEIFCETDVHSLAGRKFIGAVTEGKKGHMNLDKIIEVLGND